MKPIYFLIIVFAFGSCKQEKKIPTPSAHIEKTTAIQPKEIINENFQKIIDEADLNAVVLVFDPQKNEYHSNDFKRSTQGFLPASTFKIPNSIIALETGIVDDENTLFPWDGKKRQLKIWEQDLIFRDAFHKSCVPCYQEIARKVGVKRMKKYLQKLDYQNMIVDSSSIDLFWLTGNSKISAKQQINFLRRFYFSELPISSKTESIMKRMMVREESKNYKLSGKTGWAIRDGDNLGWFVGFIEKGKNVYFFATNVDPKDNFNMKKFVNIRSKISLDALKELNII